jgi:hypothetical protein
MPFARAALVTHLCRYARLLRDARHEACLTDVVGEGLLAIHVLASFHRENRDEGVQMVGRGDEDGVDRLLLLEHDPEVFVHRARVVGRLPRVVFFDFRLDRPTAGLSAVIPLGKVPLLRGIGERDDLAVLLVEKGPRVGPALAARTDEPHVYLVAGGDEACAAEDVPGHDGDRRRGGGRRRDELSACGSRLRVHVSLFVAGGGKTHAS